jgi:hypothetical protein
VPIAFGTTFSRAASGLASWGPVSFAVCFKNVGPAHPGTTLTTLSTGARFSGRPFYSVVASGLAAKKGELGDVLRNAPCLVHREYMSRVGIGPGLSAINVSESLAVSVLHHVAPREFAQLSEMASFARATRLQ